MGALREIMKLLTTLLLVASTASSFAIAETTDPLRVSVYGTTFNENLTETESKIIITSEQLSSSGAQNLVDALRATGMVFIGATYSGNSRDASISMGGFGENGPQNVLILVDGQPISFPTLAAANLSEIPISKVAAIEIITSEGGVNFGSNATGGVINIRLKEKNENSLSTTFGSYDTNQTNTSLSQELTDKATLSLDLTRLYTDGYRENSDRDEVKGTGSLLVKTSDTSSLKYSFSSQNVEQGLPSHLAVLADPKSTERPQDNSDTVNKTHRLNFNTLLANKYDAAMILGLKDQKMNSGYYTSYSTVETHQKTSSRFLGTNITGPNDIGEFTTGFSLSDSKFDITTIADYGYGPNSTENIGTQKQESAFVSQSAVITENLGITIGLRSTRNTDHNTNGKNSKTALDRSFAIKNKLNDHVYLTGTIDESSRFATIDELNSLTPGINFLNPQKTTSKKINLEYLSGDVSSSIQIGRLDTSDEILYDAYNYTCYGIYTCGANANMPKSKREFVKISSQVRQADNFSYGITYQFTDAEYTDGSYQGKSVAFIPKHQASAYANYLATDSLSIHSDIQYNGNRYDANDYLNERQKLKSYYLINMSSTWKKDSLIVNFGVSNLLDQKHIAYGLANMAGDLRVYPGERRSVNLGVKYKF